jgi:hypothetical protein
MIESAILYLLTSANPTGRLGALIGLDAFPDELPQNPPYPAVVYQMISGPRGYNMDGRVGTTRFRFQVDCYAETASGAKALRDACLADLSGFPVEQGHSGLIPISPPVRIHGVFADNENDSAVAALEAAGPRVKVKSLDFIVWTKET